MLMFESYERPATVAAAWEMAQEKGSALIAGGLYLRLSNARLTKLIDLSSCGLDKIEENGEYISIGAMVSERTVETSAVLDKASGGLLNAAVRHIMGVQVRNMATVGGSVWGKYGFSDLITALLALGAKVRLHKGGEKSLEAFLADKRPDGDILEAVLIPGAPVKSGWQAQRLTSTDFPALNAAAVKNGDSWRIAVGSRPGRGELCPKVMEIMNSGGDPEKAGEAAAEELSFGSDLRAAKEHRKNICSVLVERALKEAAQ